MPTPPPANDDAARARTTARRRAAGSDRVCGRGSELVFALPMANAAKIRGRLENWRLLAIQWADAKSELMASRSRAGPTVRAEFGIYFRTSQELCVAAISTQKQNPQRRF